MTESEYKIRAWLALDRAKAVIDEEAGEKRAKHEYSPDRYELWPIPKVDIHDKESVSRYNKVQYHNAVARMLQAQKGKENGNLV